MSAYLNEVKLIGSVGQQPEMSSTKDGKKIAKLSIATTQKWKDRETNEFKEKTEWHKVTVFNNKLAEIIEQYVNKGSLIMVEGRLQHEKWTDQNGQEKRFTHVVVDLNGKLLMFPSKQNQTSNDTPSQSSASNDEDEIPF